MKKFFVFLVLTIVFVCSNSKAQVSGYLFSSSTGSYTPTSGGTVLGTINNDDESFNNSLVGVPSAAVSGTGFPIGFSFSYNNITYDKFAVNTNGWLVVGTGTFTIAATTGNYTPLSSGGPVGFVSAIAGFAQDLQGQTGSELSYSTTGSAPNRTLVVQWKNYRLYGGSESINFQIRLDETSNAVSVVYGSCTGSSTPNTVQVGLRGNTNTDFNNRATTTNWSASTTGGGNGSTMAVNTTVFPAQDLTFTWSFPTPCITPTAQPTGLFFTNITNNGLRGNFIGASPAPHRYLVIRTLNNTAPVPVNGITYTVGNNALGYIESVNSNTLWFSSGLLPSTQYFYWIFSYNSLCTGGPLYLLISPLIGSSNTLAPANIFSTAKGGLWSSAATWVGGVLPGISDNAVISNNSMVTIDVNVTVYGVLVGEGSSGILQWGTNSANLNVKNDIYINTGGKLFAYNAASTGQTINVGGDFINNGYANLAVASTILNFNGSTQASSLNQTLGGTGFFEGDGTNGIIRSLYFQTTGRCVITSTQNLITSALNNTAGDVNTNGKLSIDNTAQVYGNSINTQVSNVIVTNLGVGYTTAPAVFGAASAEWTAGTSGTVYSRYFYGNNVYLATSNGVFSAITSPSHTSGVAANGTVQLLWIGTLGTLGNPFQINFVSAGTQFFYGNNLYVCTIAGTPSAAAPPVHTSGLFPSGTATFLYVGTPASVAVNFDAVNQNIRSLSIINSGSGYSSAPTIVLNLTGAVFTPATASVILFQSINGPASSLSQVSGIATFGGGLNINSTQGASLFSGVGNISTTNGGVNYTLPPVVGFAGPTAINLVTNGGSGYTSAPTIIVSGGTLISGSALLSGNFTINVANGQIVSVYLNANTTSTYSSPPSLAFSTGNATLAFPANCWPAATAFIGSNGQLTNFTITNAGFGYVTAPNLGIGTVSGTVNGGKFSVVATAPSARIALYNLTYGYLSPATSNVNNNSALYLPTNRRLNSITMNSSTGASIASNLELFSQTPLTLTSGIIDLGTNTLTFAHPLYAGTSGTINNNIIGKITLSSPGGSVTRTFPFDATFVATTGTGSLAAGSSITSITVSRTSAPSGLVNSTAGVITGNRAYSVQTNSGAVYGALPIVTLNYNSSDALSIPTNPSAVIAHATALTGNWTVRSFSSGSGSLSSTGSRTTATNGVGPIIPTGDDYYAWVSAALCVGTPITGVITGATTACMGGTISLSSSIFSSGAGLIYRWQTSSDNLNWTNTTSTTPSIFTATYAAPIWIRRVDSCTNVNTFAISNAMQVTQTVALNTPYNQGFELINANDNLPDCMAASSLGLINLTYTSATGSYNQAPRSGAKFASFRFNPGASGSWFFTDPIQLIGAQAYDAHVWYLTDGNAGFDALNIAYGTAANSGSMGAPFVSVSNPINTTYQNLKGSFTPPTTGAYVIGYQAIGTSSTNFFLTIDDLAVVVKGILPVSFTSFKGERKGAENLLSWTTATEVNNAGFELQRSADGINFTTLTYVDSKAPNGNSSAALTYNFADIKPLIGSGYYRLKQLDKDGKSSLSEVVLIKGVKPSKLELVSVYPNPVINVLNVGIASLKADKVTFIVSDITGKTIISKVMNVVSGDNLLPIDVANLANGTYTVKVICADGCETAIQKFVKQ